MAPQEAEVHHGGRSGSGSGNSHGSRDSSPPPSTTGDGENSSPPTAVWEEAAPPPPPNRCGLPAHPPAGTRVKFMCSYGGKIHPRAHDHRLAYLGGETKIVGVDRSVRFPQLSARLAALPPLGLFAAVDLCIKYQLPGEDLDALISVTNEEDVENMMFEYDRLVQRSSPSKPARLRLFLFNSAGSFPSHVKTPDRRLLADFLDSMPTPAALPVGSISEHPAVPISRADVLSEIDPPLGKIAVQDPYHIAAVRESNPGCKSQGELLLLKKRNDSNNNNNNQTQAEKPNAAATPEVLQLRAPKAAEEGTISAAAVESQATLNGETAPATTHQTTLPLAYLQDNGLGERTAVCPSSMTAMYVISSPSPHGFFSGAPLSRIPSSQGFYTAVVQPAHSAAPAVSPLPPPYPVPLNQGQADANGNANGAGASHLLAAYNSAGRPLYYVTHGALSPVSAAISAFQTTSGDEQGRFVAAQSAAAVASASSSSAALLLNTELKNGPNAS